MDSSPFPLTYLRLRFECLAETPLHLGGLRAGSNLRGALLGVMRRAVCDHPASTSPAENCPVCWLAAANEHPGQERRGYTLTPPQPMIDRLAARETFSFSITLFGEALHYLPYFVLAVPEAGHSGVGPGRGSFRLDSIWAEFPSANDWPVLRTGERLVCPPKEPANHADLLRIASDLLNTWQTATPPDKPITVRIDFCTPLRLIIDDRLLKSPDFGVFFAHILRRVDDLAVQLSKADIRPPEERQRLWNLANQVRLVESQTVWTEVPSGSSRTGQPTWISGLVGPDWYVAPAATWQELLPWLLWGEITQVGKDTVKGNGVFRLNRAAG
jgi:hypothetical protein